MPDAFDQKSFNAYWVLAMVSLVKPPRRKESVIGWLPGRAVHISTGGSAFTSLEVSKLTVMTWPMRRRGRKTCPPRNCREGTRGKENPRLSAESRRCRSGKIA